MNFGLFVQQLLLYTSALRLSHYQVYGRLHKHVKHFAPSQNTEELCSCATTQPKIKLLFHFARTSPSRQVVNESFDVLQNVAELLQIYFSSTEGKGDRGSSVVKVLCFKSEGRWFDPSWC